MPTHRDHPWERDLSLALGRRPRTQPTWRVPIAIAVVGVIGVALILTQGPEVVGPPRSAEAGPPRAAAAVSTLRTRFADRATLEVWGRTSAPDGTRVRVRLRAGKRRVRRLVPAADGRFSVEVRLPPALRGRSLRVSAVLAE